MNNGGENLKHTINSSLLKSKRIIKSYSQNKVAKLIDRTTKSYNEKENGLRPFTLEDIVKMSIALNLNINEVNEIFFDSKLTICISDAV